jgi:type II secretory pathway pseudopilin PulG
MKKSGKTMVIFLILIVVILISGISISLFLLSKETQTRKATEASLEQLKARNQKIDEALKDAQQQIDVLTGKNKDADDKINSLMEELDLESGLREQIKAENKKLKETLEAEAKAKVDLRQKLTAELEGVQAKLKESEAKVQEAAGLQQKIDDLTKQNTELQSAAKAVEDAKTVQQMRGEIIPPPVAEQEKVDLDRIVVTPDDAKQGKVLNVDTETEFLIFDLGVRHGIQVGDMMSVYRGKTYLGDVKVTRAQDEMSAADFIPPFSSRKVRKNDQVVPRR